MTATPARVSAAWSIAVAHASYNQPRQRRT